VISQAFANPAIRPGLKILVQSLDSLFIPTPSEIRKASEFLEEKMKKYSARLALVVSSSVNYGMGRMLEIFCETKDINLKVFRKIEPAKEWLESD
jgi:hypothetical protein